MPGIYKAGTVHFTLRMDSGLRDRLKARAALCGISAQELVRGLIVAEIGSASEDEGGRGSGKGGRRLPSAEKNAGES